MPLEIIGPGFGRTGTNSLKLAFEYLGFGPCHHMFEVRDNPELLPDWEAASRGETVDWDKAFANYRSQVDWPGAKYWRELTAHFPKAKVVLTVRDPDEWFDSAQATVIPFVEQRGKHSSPHTNAIAEMAYRMITIPTFDNRMSDREHMKAVFKRHIAEVQSEIPPARLLTFDVQDGWEPLCEFLEVEVPNIPFPKTNSSKQFGAEEWKKE